ncbi:MAG: GatB/YqeY domain-containing protein [Pseudomonadota bacterium]
MTLKDSIMDAIKVSMKARTKEKTNALRLIKAGIQRIEVDERTTVNDAQVIDILSKMLKQRRDSIEQFKAGGRDELAAQEAFEMDIIQEFLPTPLTDTEVDDLIKHAIEQTGADSMKDMGKVMGVLKPQMQGRADMSKVNQQLKAQLS